MLEGWPCAQDPAVEGVIREPTQGSWGPKHHNQEGLREKDGQCAVRAQTEGEIDSGDRVRKDPNKEVTFCLTFQLHLTP